MNGVTVSLSLKTAQGALALMGGSPGNLSSPGGRRVTRHSIIINLILIPEPNWGLVNVEETGLVLDSLQVPVFMVTSRYYQWRLTVLRGA